MLEYTETFTVPEWAVSYLEYGDSSGLNPDEIAQIERFEAQKAGDPTRAEMLKELIRAFRWRRDGRNDSSWKFDIEAAIYWFSAHWHGGQWSNLYSALSTSPYRPGRLCDGVEIGSQQHEMYIHLTEFFCPKFDQGGAN